jgi:hypothetical protein
MTMLPISFVEDRDAAVQFAGSDFLPRRQEHVFVDVHVFRLAEGVGDGPCE